MRKTMIAALGAATMLFATPAAAQDFPVKGGDYWTVAEITIDDGHFGDYADHLAGLYRKSVDFQKSKGWIKASYILANVNKRAGEPDLYLVTIADRPTTPAEDEARANETNAFLQSSRARAMRRAASGRNIATSAATCCSRSRSTGSRLQSRAPPLRGARAFAMNGGMRTDQQPIRITLFAPNGRMGQAIAAAVADDPGFALDPDHGDVLVDFSAPSALQASLDRAVSAGVPILIGTTGLDDLAEQPHRRRGRAGRRAARRQHLARRRRCSPTSSSAPRRCSGPNGTSRSRTCTTGMKADAPSGTALALGEAAARGRGVELNAERGRDGTGLKREPGAIGFASLRGGTVAGDHDVQFLGPDERLILSHRAESRAIFARGALAAARFLVGQGRPASTRCATSSNRL